MKFVSILFFVFGLTATSWGQGAGRISGTVTYNGATIGGVTVTAMPKNNKARTLTTKTNADGQYTFDLIEASEYTITAVANTDGILRNGQTDVPVAITQGQSIAVNLQLTDASPINERVTVSADSPQPIEQVSKTVDVIGGQEMRERADFALVDTLRTIPGFRVQQLGGFGRTATIKTRGLRNQDTAILIDGIRFRDASSITGDATAFLSDFTLTSVSRVEVLRGIFRHRVRQAVFTARFPRRSAVWDLKDFARTCRTARPTTNSASASL
jgi:hypothetical protein